MRSVSREITATTLRGRGQKHPYAFVAESGWLVTVACSFHSLGAGQGPISVMHLALVQTAVTNAFPAGLHDSLGCVRQPAAVTPVNVYFVTRQ